ncbi:hypothetical protein [Williamsoniiplasma luminosum]|uniref:Lipoprotein n=1 Tax=Williamsoniiplasma luminosum TaxID=214888 RepID=A0A2S0NJJ8_9MOLU|nr:hypothetical protein [Williamsoniiplasma luminosum]AVP49188.1 MAG: hypothetical protein C5T88_01140 [Williamsoniiplasma luminosum]
MKKLLMLLGSLSIIVGSVSTVIACDNPTSIVQSMFENAIKREIEQANRITTQKEADQYNKDFNDGKIKVEDVIIKLNYIPPTHAKPGSFYVVFTPTVVGKYNQAKEIKSSNNVIVYDVQAVFEAAIAEELNYANEIKTRSAADNYKAPEIEGVDITNDYTTPLQGATSKFQAAFNPKIPGIYKEATSRFSNANIIEFEDPAIQAEFEAAIADEKKHANEIKTQKQAEEYKNNFDPTKIPDVEMEFKYTEPTLQIKGLFYVVFNPTPFGKYQGVLSEPSNRNRFEYDHQIFFEIAIESAIKIAEQVGNREDALKYIPPIINGVDIEKKYFEPTPLMPGSFQVIFSATSNGIYNRAKSKETIKREIQYQALSKQDYRDAIEPMENKFRSINDRNGGRDLWLSLGGEAKVWDELKNGDGRIKIVAKSLPIRGVEIIYSAAEWDSWGRWIDMDFKPIVNDIYSDVGFHITLSSIIK